MVQIIAECGKTVLPNGRTGGVRGYHRACDREKAIIQLARRGFNYFVRFKEVNPASFALQYGWAEWVGKGAIYVD